MLPDIGGTEILVIAVVALIVVGPKDLPGLLRKIGAFTAKLRGMAADFRSSFDDMARQSELDDLRKQVEALRHGELAELGEDARAAVAEIEHDLAGAGVDLDIPAYQYNPPSDPDPAKPARKPRAAKAAAKPAAKVAAKPAAKVKISAAPKAAAPAEAAPKKAAARAKPSKAAG